MDQERESGPWTPFGQWLRRLRLHKGLSQTAVVLRAKPAGVITQGKLSHLERGLNGNPEPELLRALAGVYAVPYRSVIAEWTKSRFGVDVDAAADRLVVAADVVQPQAEDVSLLGLIRDMSDDDRAVVVAVIERLSRRPARAVLGEALGKTRGAKGA